MEEFIRYSVITEKNPREIVMLRGTGCRWKRCAFCDYHLDRADDEAENFALNRAVLSRVTGQYHHLEVINSGSFGDLDEATMEEILRVCRARGIDLLHLSAQVSQSKSRPAWKPLTGISGKISCTRASGKATPLKSRRRLTNAAFCLG